MKYMSKQNGRTIYIISGPCGVGKSTISRIFAEEMEHVVLIEGDKIHSMLVGKDELPWERQLTIVWENILSVSRNFIEHGLDVVIDYVVEDELEWFCEHMSDLNVEIKYVVLRADKNTIVERLNKRGNPDLIERSLFLLSKLEKSSLNKPYLYDTTNKKPGEILEDLRRQIQVQQPYNK
jgi:broad-specificity NMP kinase